jgi:hypothetical protein
MEMYTQGHISETSHVKHKTAPCNLILNCRSLNVFLYYACFRMTQINYINSCKSTSAGLQHFLITNYKVNQNEYIYIYLKRIYIYSF